MASVIIGVRTLQQLEDNMDAADSKWKLTPDQVSSKVAGVMYHYEDIIICCRGRDGVVGSMLDL